MTATANTLFDPGLLSGGENNYNILRNQTLTPLNIPVGIADTLFAMNATAGALTDGAASTTVTTQWAFKRMVCDGVSAWVLT